MANEEFPGNSKMPRQPPADARPEMQEKKVQQIVTGTAVRRKKTLGRRFRETFLSGPDSRSVFVWVWEEMLVPAGKDLFIDSVNAGLERKVYGPDAARRRPGGSPGANMFYNSPLAGRTSYNQMSRRDPMQRPEEPRLSRRARTTHDFGEVLMEHRHEATAVLDQMYELLSKFDAVTVGDLLDMLGQPSDFPDQRWGWDDLRGSSVQRARGGGYSLTLPPTIELD